MDWNFSLGWMFLGLCILIAGTLITANYQKISDTMLSGVSSYERCKYVGLIVAGVGFIVMTNLHTLFLTLLVNIVFKRQ